MAANTTIPGRVAPTIGVGRTTPPDERLPDPPPRRSIAAKGDIVIGAGVQVQGTIDRCASITVNGVLQSDEIRCETLEVTDGGRFKGAAAAARAEISGTFHGELVADVVTIQGTGQVEASIEYGELQIERGASVSGKLQARPRQEGR